MVNYLISVIIPTYNSATHLTAAINSVICQSYQFWEIIVIDDGSTDNTFETIQLFLPNDKIKYFKQENMGPATARNHGIKTANGDFVAFLDADDTWLSNKLAVQMAYLLNNPDYGLVYTDMIHRVNGTTVHESFLQSNGYAMIASGWIYDNLLHENFIFTPTVLVRHDVLERVGLFDTTLKISEDRDLWLRIAEHCAIGFVDQPLTVRNRHETNITNDRELYMTSQIAMFEKHHALWFHDESDLGIKRTYLLESTLANRYSDLGNYYLRNLRKQLARKAYNNSRKYGSANGIVLRIFLTWFPIHTLRCMIKINKIIKHFVRILISRFSFR